jgi:hypothetical protein
MEKLLYTYRTYRSNNFYSSILDLAVGDAGPDGITLSQLTQTNNRENSAALRAIGGTKTCQT